MGENIEAGPTGTCVATEEPTTQSGVTRLQTTGQQSVDQAQNGPWIVWELVAWQGYMPIKFSRYIDAVRYWARNGGYLCKNHTPV